MLAAMTVHSYLFVPADRPQRYAKALATSAHAVIIDLEDAVAPQAKSQARELLAAWLNSAEARPVHVRLNGPQTPWFSQDLALCHLHAVSGIVLPKAESPEELAHLARAVPGKPLLALIESAAGMAAARQIAAAPGVQRLVFGSIDFQADLGIEGEDDALLAFRSELVLASRLAQLQPPVDGVSTALDDRQATARETARARQLGFGAKLCIHPSQVAPVNEGFAPRPQELAWATRVLQAFEASGGAAVAVDGKMVDAPVLKRAQALLASART